MRGEKKKSLQCLKIANFCARRAAFSLVSRPFTDDEIALNERISHINGTHVWEALQVFLLFSKTIFTIWNFSFGQPICMHINFMHTFSNLYTFTDR